VVLCSSNHPVVLPEGLNTGGQDIEITTLNSDYRKTADGFVMPFSQELILPGLTLTITNKKVEINKEIDRDIFEKPKELGE
jgi:hypothetical protein